ncbi:MAG: hypothetical protein AABN95_07550 [Acidobacteriota bacterium]
MIRFAIAVSCGFILCLSACTNNPRTLVSYVPASSYAVLAVKWHSVEKDPELKRIAKGAEIEKIFADLGVSSQEVSEFAVFGDLQNLASGSTGLIAKGTFNTKDLVNSLKKRGWAEEDLEGKRVYVNPSDSSYLTTFDAKMFMLGTQSGVKAVIAARAKPELRFTSNPAYKRLSARFEGKQYPILMIAAFPQATQDMASAALQLSSTVMDLVGVGPLGELLNQIGYAKGLSCGISRTNDAFPIHVSAVMKDEDAAEFVAGTLNILKNVAALARRNNSQRDVEAAKVLKTISIERSRDVISIRMTMPAPALREFNR